MLFSSITFIYFFLPVTIFLYYASPQKGRNLVLFVMSVLFYAWGEPVSVLLMLAQIVVSYVLLWLADRFRARRAVGICYILSVFLPFMALFYFKYFHFFMNTVFRIKTKAVTLPIGISFYTFQIASYCIDVYKKRVERQRNLITYAAYVTLFPQLVAGPIVRYSEIQQTLIHGVDSSDVRENFGKGLVRFVIGLGKKVLIANVVGEFVSDIAMLGHRNVLLSWGYAIAVALQIYFDFSGYSDMAIGLGSMLGFQFPENFRYPFISKSVKEFWRRWHITLGAWFRDYIYIPMGGSRVCLPRWMINVFVVWLLTGLWHGAGWNFIMWGLLFAVLLVFEKGIGKWYQHKPFLPKAAVIGIKHLYVLMIILVSFLIFHNDSLSDAFADIQALFSCGSRIAYDVDDAQATVFAYLMRNRVVILGIGMIGATPLPLWLWTKLQRRMQAGKAGEITFSVLKYILTVGLLVFCTAYLIDGSFNPFLYFRF